MITIMQERLFEIFSQGDSIARADGDALFNRGDAVGFVFLVQTGRVALQRVTPAGATLFLHQARAGEIVAEASLYSPVCHCDAVALGPATVLRLPKSRFLGALDADADLSREWAAHLAHSVQAARMRAEIRGLRTVSERLDTWLAAGHAIPPKGQYQDLAAELGVTREALYRELARRGGTLDRGAPAP